MLADAEASGTPIDGPDGLLAQITKSVLERALDVEIADHLGYEHGDPAGNGSGNSRNGHGRKTVLTTAGPVDLEVPRDRNGTFDPVIVPKRKRRLGQVEDMILSLYARGMSTRDITEHLAEVYGASVSAATVSRVTEVVADEIAAWQSRPVDPVYPILYIDAIRLKIRDGGVVSNKAAHVVIGVDVEGIKQVLGVWIQQTEGAKFWHGVLTELRNRGAGMRCSFAVTAWLGCRNRSPPFGPRRSSKPVSCTCCGPACATPPTPTAKRWPPRCARSTPQPPNRPLRSPLSSFGPSGRPNRLGRSRSGTDPGLSSCRFWPSPSRSARSFTPPTPSNR
ncbi:transposase, Mutator family protein [Mycobacterium avium subsp. avium 2285 (R)]|nr:transposase, Mutator family protein [Mycobacterium avium subsp. avium 2285 (R)]